jgi:aldose 1-epimerase
MKTSALLSAFALLATPFTLLSASPAGEPFGKMPDSRPVSVFTLSNKNGIQVRVSDLGATLVSVRVPDRKGVLADVTHGFDSAAGYLSDENPYFGATVGRFGNRIANGTFSLDGKSYLLAKNNAPGDMPCHLHGGTIGFNKKLWKVVTNDTPRSINDHRLTIPASRYLPTNAGFIPTGKLDTVKGTPMDFRKAHRIGDRVGESFEALTYGGGYDHCWVLDRPKPNGLAVAARLEDPSTGRRLTIRSNQPAIQFYGGNFLDGTVKGKNGAAYQHRTALCLETENFPDAPNQAAFPSARLNPGETYRHEMLYQFGVK